MSLLEALGLETIGPPSGRPANPAGRARSNSAPPRMTSGEAAPPEDVAAQRGQEASAFAKFNAEFDTFRDASNARVSPDEQKAMRVAVEAIIRRVDARRQQIEARGESPDLDELAAEFAHIPRNFWPPRFKKELQDWRAVRDAMANRAVKKMFEGSDKFEVADGVLDKFSTVVELAEGRVEKVFDEKKAAAAGHVMATLKNSEAARQGAETVEKLGIAKEVLTDLGLVTSGVKATLGMVKGIKGMAEAEGPVQHKMSSEETLEGLKELVKTGMDIATEFVPVVGAVKDGAQALDNLRACYKHYKLQAETGELKDEAALDVVSQLARAFGQEEGRQSTLKKKSGVDAAANAVTATGKGLVATGVGAKVGAAALVVGKGISIGSTVYFKTVDWSAADAAQKVLAEARAGNESAMQQVFANHAAYAKMLIAIYARNKHPLAVKYFVQRGLTEADLEHPATSMDILLEFGLKRSEEEEDPKTFSQTLTAGVETVLGVAEALGGGVKKLLVKVGALSETPPDQMAQASADLGIARMYSTDEVAAMHRTLDAARERRDTIRGLGGTPPAHVEQNIERIGAVLAQTKKDAFALHASLVQQKARHSEIRARWASEADEIRRGRSRPLTPALDPTSLLPIVDAQIVDLQREIDAAADLVRACSA